MENLTLYRKVSLKEVVDIRQHLFRVPETRIFDTRKWFTTSMLGAARFENPYVDLSKERQVLLKIGVDLSFFDDKSIKMALFRNEKYKFYRNNSIEAPVIVCPTHLVTPKYSSYGMRSEVLPYFNERVNQIDVIEMGEVCSLYIEENFGPNDLDIVSPSLASDEAYFYVALPYDLALALKKERLIYSEGVKGNKKRYISRDLEALRKADSTSSSIMLVKLKPANDTTLIMANLAQRDAQALTFEEIFRINPLIESAEFVEYDRGKDFHHVYIGAGSNARVVHEPQAYKGVKKVSKEEYAEFNNLLLSGDFESAIERIYPVLLKLKGCHQLDPKQIDDVYDHAIKSVRALDKAVEWLSFVLGLTNEDIALMKMGLLFHDVGKPFMPLTNRIDRYTQFTGHFDKMGTHVIADVFGDIPDAELLKVMTSLSKVNGKNKYHKFFEALKANVPDEKIEKYVWMMFLMRVSHIMSLKPQKFCAYYNDILLMFEEYIKYNNRKWRREDGKIISHDLISTLRGFESYLQPDIKMSEKPEETDVMPLLIDIMDKPLESSYKEDYDSKAPLYGDIPEQMNLETAIWAVKGSFGYPILQNEIEALDLDMILKSRVHGVYHNEKVAFLVCLIALMKNLNEHDVKLLILAALYHDCGRENDYDETRHGVLGAMKFGELFSLSLDEEDLRLVKFMIEAHAIADSSFEELLVKYNVPEDKKERYLMMVSILKDADGLDRVRISRDLPYSKLNPKYLRNAESMTLIKAAHQLNECFMKQIVYEGENIPRKLYRR